MSTTEAINKIEILIEAFKELDEMLDKAVLNYENKQQPKAA